MSEEAKCNCQRCGERIAFPVEMTDQEVICPHCGRETTLLSPRVRKADLDSNVNVPSNESKSETSDTTKEQNKIALMLLPVFIIGIILFFVIHNQNVEEQEARNWQDALTPHESYTQKYEREMRQAREEQGMKDLTNRLNQQAIDQSNQEAEFQTWRSNYLKTNYP